MIVIIVIAESVPVDAGLNDECLGLAGTRSSQARMRTHAAIHRMMH